MIHELRHIRAFLKISETRNFTRASSDLHISQSALTVQIQQLEESLGIQLFDRNKRGVTLTSAGKDVYGPLQRLFNDAQAIVDHAHELGSASTGFVTIAALPTVAASVLPELVKRFVDEYPGIRVQISDVVAERVRDQVLKRHVDIGIGTRNGRDTEFRATPLFRDHLILFAPLKHPLAIKKSITLREAAEFNLILPTRDSSVRETVDAIAHRERFALQTRYETNFMATALGMVRIGLGVAILPESAAGHEADDFTRIPLRDKASVRQIELLQRRDFTLSPAAEIFVEHLSRYFETEKRRSQGGPSRSGRKS